MPLDRRQFLGQSVAAATANLLSLSARTSKSQESATVDASKISIIDCHQHLWDLDKFRLPWIKPATLLGRSYVMSDYLAAIDGTGIEHSIYMEVDLEPSQQQAEAEHLIEICKAGKAPTVAAVVSGRPAEEGFADYVRQFRDSPYIKGIRQVLHGSAPRGFCLSEPFVRGMQLLGELNLSFDLCLRPKELADGAQLAKKCPETRFIVDHCGNADPKAFLKAGDPRLKDVSVEHDADQWYRDIDQLAAQKNVVCKISGIVARVPREWSAADLAPIVNHCLDAFGPSRVLFGSDWPVCLLGAPLAQWVAALREIVAARPRAEQQALLRDNGVRFYGLKISNR